MNFLPRRRRKPEIIIVSLIDIFAILLIFMAMTTQVREEQPAVTIKLPESKSAVEAPAATAPVVLTISPNAEVFVGATSVAPGALKAELQKLLKQDPPPQLALKADENAPFETVIQVLDIMKEAGVKGSLSAFTQPEKK